VLVLFIKEAPAELRGAIGSLEILLVGYGSALLAAVPLGLIAGWVGRLRRTVTPITRVLGPVPPTVYIPYAIVMLPTFMLSSMFVIFIGAFWPVFINTLNGVHTIEGRLIDSARVLKLDHRTMITKVIFPATLPSIVTGATIGLAMSFILLTAAEMIGATSGLGWWVKYFSDFADYPRVIVGILYTGVVVTAIMFGFDRVEKHLLRWRQ
jgi:NitT/TauT family transport system permease protein